MDFNELQRNYGGKFVATVDGGTVLASGKTFNEVMSKIQRMSIVNKSGLAIKFIKPLMPKFGVEQHETKKEGGDSSRCTSDGEQAIGNSITGKET
jgi:hypothetical protein